MKIYSTYLPFLLGFGSGILTTFYALMLADIVRYVRWKRRRVADCAAYGATEAPIPSPADVVEREIQAWRDMRWMNG